MKEDEEESYSSTDDDEESLPDSTFSSESSGPTPPKILKRSEYNENFEDISSTSSNHISESKDPPIKTYKARNVSGVGGRKYEVLTSAWLLLRLTLMNKNVKDFEFSAENIDYFPFVDDIVVEITSDIKEKYLIQLKNAENDRALTSIKGAFTTTTKKTKKNPNPITFTKILQKEPCSKAIVLTNRKFNIKNKTTTKKNPDPDKAFKIEIDQSTLTVGKQKKEDQAKIILFNELYDKEYCYGFVDKDKNNNILENLLLYTNQRDNETIKEEIKIMLQEFVRGEEKLKEEKLEESIRIYTEFIEVWHHRSGVKAVLTKSVMKDVIAWCLLHPYAKFWTFPREPESVPEDSRKFRTALLNKRITYFAFTSKSFDTTNKIWADATLNSDEFEKEYSHYEIMCPKHNSAKESILSEELNKKLWIMKKCPMSVEENDTTRNIIEVLCENQHFVLWNKEKNSGNSFKQLSDLKEHQKSLYDYMLKKFSCKIQGRSEIRLEILIQESEEIPKIISTNELADMLEEPLKIAEKGEELEFYIERSLTNNVVEYNFLKSIKGRAMIIISCVRNIKKIKSQFPYLNSLKLEKFLSEEEHNEEIDVLFTATKCPEETFNIICAKRPNKTCHHFKINEITNGLEWVRSNQNIDEVKVFLCQNEFLKENYSSDSKINLICANPGMGKSTLLKKMKNDSSPSSWVILICARDHFLHYETKGDNINEFKQYILKYISEKHHYTEFDTKLLEIFQREGRVFYYWDGLDELSDKNLDVVKNIIKKLAAENGCQLWLISRNNLRQDLENEFKVIARTIKQIDEDDEKKYIEERLKSSKKYKGDDFSGIYDKIQTNIQLYSCSDILGIPLHIYLLVELLVKDQAKYVALLEGILSLADLYEHFVEATLDRYCRIKEEIDIRTQKKTAIDYFQKASLKLYFDPRLLKEWNAEIEIDKDINSAGFIMDSGESTLTFVHSSFGEYFTALYLSQNLQKVSRIRDFTYNEKYDNIRFFLDLIWSKHSPAHIAVMHKNYQLLEKYDESVILYDRNQNGQSTLQLACSWSKKYKNLKGPNEHTVDHFSKFLSGEKENAKILYWLCDKFSLKECSALLQKNRRLFYSEQSLSLLPIVRLTSKKKTNLQIFEKHVATILYYCFKFDIEEAIDICKDKPYIKNKRGKSMFYQAVSSNSINILKKIVKDGEYKQMLLKNKEPLVWTACEEGYHEIAKLLIDAGVKVRAPYRNVQKLIHRAFKNGHLEIVRLLIENGDGDPNFKDNEDKTLMHHACKNSDSDMLEFLIIKYGLYPLHYACKNGDDIIIKMLLDAQSNVNVADQKNQMPIHYGCINRNNVIVKLLLTYGANPNCKDIFGKTPLHYACINRNNVIVKLLLTYGANPNCKDIFGKTPLHYACTCNKIQNEITVNLLMKAGAKINVTDEDEKMLMHYACVSGNKEIINLLIQDEGIMDAADKFGKLPIHYSCENGHYEISKIFINEKEVQQVNTEDTFGKMPIHYACEEGHYEVVELLIRNKAKLDHEDKNGEMPLHRAFYRQHYEVVKLLIDSGVPLDIPDKYGETPIHYACKRALKDVVKLLLDKEIKTDVVNKCNKTPVYYACEEGYYEIVKMMFQKGADLHVVDKDGKSPFHRACERGHYEIVKMMFQKGADLHVVDKDGKSPFHGACERGHALIVEFLIPWVNVNATDNLHKTPLHGACKKGHLRIIQLLIKNGAKFDIPDSKGKMSVDRAITYKWHRINKKEKTKLLQLIRSVIDSNDQNKVCEKVLLELCTNWEDFKKWKLY